MDLNVSIYMYVTYAFINHTSNRLEMKIWKLRYMPKQGFAYFA